MEYLERQIEALQEREKPLIREKEQLRREKEQLRREKEHLLQRAASTQLSDYILNVERHVFARFSIEPNPAKTSNPSATKVEGKFYPQHFQPWTDFAAIHNATFDAFSAALAGRACFPSLISVESLGNDLSPKVSSELALRPFVRAAIEKPAATVVSAYLGVADHGSFIAAKFHGNVYGMALEGKNNSSLESSIGEGASASSSAEPRREKRSPVQDMGVPDRWLIAYSRADRPGPKKEPVLVGEIKPAHALHGAKLNQVLSTPGDDFFLRAARQDAAESDSTRLPGEVYVAKALCQAFHYMISSGLEFGYVASGEGLVFLRVTENDPNTLYYFISVLPANPGPGGVAAARAPRETAAAHLATLSMLSLDSIRRSARWIGARNDDLTRWPKSKATVPALAEIALSLLPHDRGSDGDNGGGNAGGGSSTDGDGAAGAQSPRKRPHADASSSSTTGTGSHVTGAQQARLLPGPVVVTTIPTLPYCTQGCLGGLCRGQRLDPKCPNVELHRTRGKDVHPLTVAQFQARLVAQLADDIEQDCQSLLFHGHFGRYGALFKITITGLGYTLVAKAVQAMHRRVLQHEAVIYEALDAFQGYIIPVCLGAVELARSIPLRNCQYVSNMLLMSYAGPDMSSQDPRPAGVDLDAEAERTWTELWEGGLANDDIHNANLAWNEEVRRVMQFDFDDAGLRFVPAAAAAAKIR